MAAAEIDRKVGQKLITTHFIAQKQATKLTDKSSPDSLKQWPR